jgi:N-carbamoyl-L-amino-acid hydrolase
VLAGLQVIETVQEHNIVLDRPLAVGFFTDEEGSRFAPDMCGSLAYVGGLGLEEALDITGIDGARLGDELERIGYAGVAPLPAAPPHAFVELHIEQGPVLDHEGVTIGAVTGVQGISWQEVTLTGQSNHAGTTPMSLRRDPGLAAFEIAAFIGERARSLGGSTVGTVGSITLKPNLINVIARSATFTIDVRNTDEAVLRTFEREIDERIASVASAHELTVERRQLARFEPVEFDPAMVDLVEQTALDLGLSVQRMPSGAGHDAQMLARVCPTSMIFVPSVDGLSHNPREFTQPADLVAGANVLLRVLCSIAGTT